MTEGHRFFVGALAQVSDDELSAPSALPRWTGRHILSHVGHNARALGHLAYWAATGVPTSMYSGPTARAAEIVLGARWDGQRLRMFVEFEQEALAAALEKLYTEQWATEVVTAQGRHVTAAAIPWLRARELWIHTTDLHAAADFSDFPPVLLDELIVDALKRRLDANGEVIEVRATDRDRTPTTDEAPAAVWIEGGSPDLARWLTGRGVANIHTSDQSPLPALGPWL